MKVKISKSQWEKMGSEAGWMKKAQNNPSTQQPEQAQSQHDASKWTFNRLMQDANFKQTFQTLKNQKANEKKILQHWKSIGIQYQSIPEILEVIGTDTI